MDLVKHSLLLIWYITIIVNGHYSNMADGMPVFFTDNKITNYFCNITSKTRFIIDDPFDGVGFNGCRGNYIRAAHLVRYIMITKDEVWVLVLPP